ncbi:TonB-dependent receptor [Reichenbachiella agarivorans]|uniref:TonB-dependent receptor n=1 Tax=Reichenbachiella agarivorans TaxID=2979464 RepID=A0ABY6CND9_9BACT|nr:TonB-dependent receptor [Reichenbachiella agarivorans]UXP31894.1 TonB-dependent receptor [Reichenbachiella agarivorans]
MESGVHTTKEKALSLNLNESIYGSLAEIGAGQEVAANFFKAGGASGTIAKTMSAYDMDFSDAIYGATDRYVCEDKLHKMLNKEYGLLSVRLTRRADTSKFFAFANTIETINFKKTNQGHGWLGVRFQMEPNAEHNDIIIHVVLKDPEAIWQQEVLGKIGVNLIYACFNHSDNPDRMMVSIVDNISEGRVEIDYFKLTGPNFRHVDNRLMSLKLVKYGLSHAAMFDKDGHNKQPSTFLYKKNVCVLRGYFRPFTLVSEDMIQSAINQFHKDTLIDPEKVLITTELTINDLTRDGKIDDSDFLDRVKILNSLGHNVLISNYTEHYKLAAYLYQFTKGKRMSFVIGTDNLRKLFDEEYYFNLKGGLLESFSRLFGSNVKLLIYPTLFQDKIETTLNFTPPKLLEHLYLYLKENDFIEDIDSAKRDIQHIQSSDVLDMIQSGQSDWEALVPATVADIIKKNDMFGYSSKNETATH